MSTEVKSHTAGTRRGPAGTVGDIPADVLDAARRIWFASLGAMVLAQEEGVRMVDGTAHIFSLLVEKGQEMEKDGFPAVNRAKTAVGTAEQTWVKLQRLIDAQITTALQRLGVPTKGEVADLSQKIEQLTASIEALKAHA